MTKIHRALDQGSEGETFCHIPYRCAMGGFVSARTGVRINVVTKGTEADFTCNTCWHVYRKVKPTQ